MKLLIAGASDELYRAYVSFEKQHGDRDAIEEATGSQEATGNHILLRAEFQGDQLFFVSLLRKDPYTVGNCRKEKHDS